VVSYFAPATAYSTAGTRSGRDPRAARRGTPGHRRASVAEVAGWLGYLGVSSFSPGLPPLERRRPARLPDGRHNIGPFGIKEFKILPNGPSCTAGHRSTPDRRLRCSLARVMSGSRGSRGSGSACLRCRVSAVRRCLVIRICDIARLLWSWVSVVTAKGRGGMARCRHGQQAGIVIVDDH
jgi:hypothetical protein